MAVLYTCNAQKHSQYARFTLENGYLLMFLIRIFRIKEKYILKNKNGT